MITLEEVRQRCRLEEEEGHWIWTGACNQLGRLPVIYAPDLSAGGVLKTQTGMRAVWQMHTGKPIPAGHRVARTCKHSLCLNPACMVCASSKVHGARTTASGHLQGRINRIVANRAINRKASKLTPALLREIQASSESSIAMGVRLGISPYVVRRARTGRIISFAPVGGVFSGLAARSSS